MFDGQFGSKRSPKDEAEKPFWISFADLMTALMILFLVVMCVALLSVTKKITETERKTIERDREIVALLELLEQNVKECGEATIRRERYVIDFGPQANFDFGSHKLTLAQERYLRACVPNILLIAGGELGKRWIKRIVVEGYTDQKGSYLYNLNLSLQRSQRVLCTLLGKGVLTERVLTSEERKQVQQLFLVGGYSFNSATTSPERSRRVEMRLEFWGLAEARDPAAEEIANVDTDTLCQLDVPPRAPTNVAPRVPAPQTPAPAPPQDSLLRRLFPGN